MELERYWINQPSTLQPHHKLHGRRVLACKKSGENYAWAYFTEGDVVAQEIDVSALSPGWPQR